MEENKYTPALICGNNSKTFNIPIYQRLFTWERYNIRQLLNDMETQFKKDKDSPYYIGMLTEYNTDLVDGQQRFTVLSIIASVFQKYYSKWSKMKGKLHLLARPNDEKYLESLFTDNPIQEYANKKMSDGREEIVSWIKENEGKISIAAFSKYVYNNCTFFIASLPETYKPRDLNKYFESMNSTGRNLEAHEIIKVKDYLKSMDSEQDFYNSIWNIVSDMDKPLIRKRTEGNQKDTEESFQDRYTNSIYNFKQNIKKSNFNNILNDFCKSDETNKIYKTIRQLTADGHNPDVRRQDKYYGEGTHSMLNFQEFILLILYITLDSDARNNLNVNDFFNVHKIQEIFSQYTRNWRETEWKSFGKELLRYRLIYDYYVIRIPNSEIGDYKLDFSYTKSNKIELTVISQLQSLLYVDSSSKTYYRWVVPYMEFLNEKVNKNEEITPDLLFENLRIIDNGIDEHSVKFLDDESSYSFGGRRTVYFLRRLDFYLWLQNHNTRNTKNEDYSIINNFKFRRSVNSQEHLHPQNDENKTGYQPWYDEKHKFGNLFLISSSFNLSQSDDTINTKFGRIKDQIEYAPSIESIKLYKIYNLCNKDEKKWDLQTMQKHQEEMIQFLKNSYK